MGKEPNRFEWDVCEKEDDWKVSHALDTGQRARRRRNFAATVALVTIFVATLAGQSTWDSRPGATAIATGKTPSVVGNLETVTASPPFRTDGTGDPSSDSNYYAGYLFGPDMALMQAVLDAQAQGDDISIIEVSYPQDDIAAVGVSVWPEDGSTSYRETRFYEQTAEGWQHIHMKFESQLSVRAIANLGGVKNGLEDRE